MRWRRVRVNWVLGLIVMVSLASIVLFPVTAVSVRADGDDVARQEASVVLMRTGFTGFFARFDRHATGFAELSLRTDRFGNKELEAEASATGLSSFRTFTLCVNNMSFGRGVLFLGVMRFEGERSSTLDNLHGLMVSIKRGFGCGGFTVLEGTVP